MATTRKRPRPEIEETQAECPFIIQPSQRWIDMKQYKSFVLNHVSYYEGNFIFVANGSTVKRQKKSDSDWVAKILEIRASDESHIYVRVYLTYWLDELPSRTQEGKRTIQGRQSYHGQDELIASNHMQVISVYSIAASATVNYWDENKDEVQSALYWRQVLDVRNMRFSPHKSVPIKQEQEEEPKRFLNLNESGAARHSINVDPEEQRTTIKLVKTEHSMAGAVAFGTESKKGGRRRRRKPSAPGTARLYEGLFKAAIKSDSSALVIEISDLRNNVRGEKKWTGYLPGRAMRILFLKRGYYAPGLPVVDAEDSHLNDSSVASGPSDTSDTGCTSHPFSSQISDASPLARLLTKAMPITERLSIIANFERYLLCNISGPIVDLKRAYMTPAAVDMAWPRIWTNRVIPEQVDGEYNIADANGGNILFSYGLMPIQMYLRGARCAIVSIPLVRNRAHPDASGLSIGTGSRTPPTDILAVGKPWVGARNLW
ncbi:hypothetical protein DL762_009597 [Monosporascus cannonballus]|uniref:BAH domain-containing protein n=1 Tax=Monosporascus cannonballus TaxID=155416 RepID=A0ABY0GW31_9PEZI|nr:hypothetical protein DL762_009597 [Monosporascus cannonballus]